MKGEKDDNLLDKDRMETKPKKQLPNMNSCQTN